MTKIPPKQQVLLLLDQCLATGIRGRVAEVIKQAKNEIEGRSGYDERFYQQAAADVSDPQYPGLVFKVAKHKRRWILRYTPKGAKSTKQRTLGHFPEMSVAQAREAWAEARAELQGQSVVAKVEMPVERLVELYLAYARQHRSQWRREQQILERHALLLWQGLDAAKIGPDDIEAVLRQVEQGAQQRGSHGQRAKGAALSTLRHLFDVARGHIAIQPEAWLDPNLANPCETIRLPQVISHRMPLMASEIGRYHKALLGLPLHEQVQPLLLLQLSLLVPFSVLCRMTWAGVNWERGLVQVKTTRGQEKVVPVTPAAMEILKLQRRQSGQSVWVFPAMQHPEKPMPHRYPSELMAAVREHLSLPDQFTADRICRFGRDWLVGQGSALAEAALPLDKAQLNPLTEQQIRQNLQQWQQHLTNLRLSG
ncbi:integrase arm-type DNA-binding domain-containing protein [Ferrimonas marina]|uniref:Integrase DNA-binding domain-containing protein n=1 Tax=Ferrimonas marina TaxID=299255 RepID=A0A1M5NL62_9GAMM|nr:integrase arm-type DNA-binding domain-containing protein [Ferrimonas marina]SHG90252.1 protein of unknown function [Ferrimonas marina]